MTIERPMFPPRAESVDSFSHQPAVRQPDRKTRTSEFRGRARGTFAGRGKAWTEEETELARRLLADRKPESEFLRLLGRSKSQAYSRMIRQLTSPVEGLDWLKLPKERRVDVPDGLWAEASDRLNAPRSLSAWICGDPAPGYSALDQRTGGLT